MRKCAAILCLFIIIAAFQTEISAGNSGEADTIYFGDNIITVSEIHKEAKALAVKDGKILEVGSKDEVFRLKGPSTKVIDLKDTALLPAFFDPHSHLSGVALQLVTTNLFGPPVGAIDSMDKLKNALREGMKKSPAAPGQWIVGIGYDNTSLKENRHPDRSDLDDVSKDTPVIIVHDSGHFAVVNSKALELAHIDASTPDPEGGRILRKDGTKEPNGVLEESAQMLAFKVFPLPSFEVAKKTILRGLNHYASLGMTTAIEGCGSGALNLLMRKIASEQELPIDLIDCTSYNEAVKSYRNYPEESTYHGGFRVGGVKLICDGSIQGYTAFLSQPYYVQPGRKIHVRDACSSHLGSRMLTKDDNAAGDKTLPGKGGGDFKGYPDYNSQEELESYLLNALQKGWHIFAHCNGGAAIEEFMGAFENALQQCPVKDHRTTIIHSQDMTEKQLDRAKVLGIYLSLFPSHVYYWGDKHRDIFLGPERAARIDPTGSALKKSIPFTIHTDAFVTPPSVIDMIAFAVNRKTQSGSVLGPDQRIPVMDAIRAVTINAARQYFEEGSKGSLDVGKKADFVILSKNPLKVEKDQIRSIKVLKTIKNGKTIYGN
ncbi:MAG: amidohydrolase [Candidatus Xenobiia bacterium LiM19]